MTPLAPLWSAFPPTRRLHADADLLVVDKPWGLATHAPEEDRRDDVVSWLREDLERTGHSAYLGIHQRLDRDTSGVLLFARRKEANRALARQFEGRTVRKTYVAVVEGRVPNTTELRHFLGALADGVVGARPAHGAPRRGEQLAVTGLTTLERRSGRALVELRPETGRTHQLRAQLSAIGAPIVGDVAYGGPPEVRPMLHARSLGLRHPATDEAVTFEAPIPVELSRSLLREAPGLPSTVAEAAALVGAALERRYGIIAAGDTTALRLANEDGDALPGIAIDLYGEHAVLSVYSPRETTPIQPLADALIGAGVRGVYAKYRPKDASRVVDTRREDLAPRAPISGEAAAESFEILERGAPLEVHLGDGLSTGVFLDQRENRRRVRELASGKTVLNLFGYTGAFSVVAALGGARATTTVDVSRTALAWAERNLARVGAAPPAHATVEADVTDFLGRAAKRGERFDLVLLDPPSFSTTKRSTFSAETDYAKLASLALRVTADGGRLLACTNHRGVTIAKFRKALHEACRLAGVEATQVRTLPTPADFPPAPGREAHLKSLLVTLGTRRGG